MGPSGNFSPRWSGGRLCWLRAYSQMLCGFMKLTTIRNGRSCFCERNSTACSVVPTSFFVVGGVSNPWLSTSLTGKNRCHLPKYAVSYPACRKYVPMHVNSLGFVPAAEL